VSSTVTPKLGVDGVPPRCSARPTEELRGLLADVAAWLSRADERIRVGRKRRKKAAAATKPVGIVAPAEARQPGSPHAAPIPFRAMDTPQRIRDRRGRDVLLTVERWRHIVSAHPEIEIYEKEVHRAVESPTTVLAGREPDEEWLYLESAGPSRWLKVVVVFDSEDRGRIITSFARRRKP
jgi:hypothetical protein